MNGENFKAHTAKCKMHIVIRYEDNLRTAFWIC